MVEKLAAGIDLGGTNTAVALVNSKGVIVRSRRTKTNAGRPADAVCDEIGEIVHALIRDCGVTRDDIVGLGIGAPGPLSHRDGIIYQSANLDGWKNIRLRRAMLERTGLPTILDNDANAAAYGEFWVGAGRATRDMVALTLGTGIGAGVIIDGQIVRGHFENAAELGHMIVEPNGRPCSCGQRGCLEQYASAGNLARYCQERMAGGESSSLKTVLDQGTELTSRHIADAARDGDPFALEAWDKACHYIALGCVNVQHAFNPERIVLAGGMTKSGDFLLSRVVRHFKGMYWQLLDDVPELAISVLGDDAGVIGAAGLAWAAREDGV